MSKSQIPSRSEGTSREIDEMIAAIGGWRGQVLGRMRKLVLEADPAISETIKWRKPTNPAGVPVWERAGILCTGETYKDKVKLSFGRGALLKDPAGLFNASLDGNSMRAIDIREGDEINCVAFTALVREAVELNLSRSRK